MTARILLADDDPHLREVVRYALAREGWDVEEAANGAVAVQRVLAAPPDLVVLDVLMPELDGLEACRRIRAASAVPILFLSSRGEELDRVLGLELGGDDYLTKPFSPRELVSRIRAIFRRVRPAAPERPAEGSVRTDAATFRAYVGETVLDLTATEFRLLHALVGAPGRVFSRDDLVVHAYPDERFVADRTVDSHMRRIRAKLRVAGAGEPIETVHGVGFRLVRP
ncbi:MAG: hypothetical protein RLZZ383_2035 [Pseudomonadota bacterium]